MEVYAVFINEVDEINNRYVNILVGLYRDEAKAKEIIKDIPKNANPHYMIYEIE